MIDWLYKPQFLKKLHTYRKTMRDLCAQYGVDARNRTPTLLWMQIDMLAQQHALLHYLLDFVTRKPHTDKQYEERCAQLRRGIEKAVSQLDKLTAQTPKTGPTPQDTGLRAAAAAHAAGQ